MDPAVIGAIISAAGAATSAVINKSGSVHKGRRRLNRQKELAAYNQELQNATYEKYQSPAAMMRQYKEAGLNPNLAYQNASAGGPGVAQVDSSAADYDTQEEYAQAASEAFNSLSSGLGRYYELKSQQIANSNAEIVGGLKGIQAQNEIKKGEALDLANDLMKRTSDYKVEMMAAKSASERFMLNYRQTTWLQQEKNKIDLQLDKLQNSKVSRRKHQEEITNLLYSRRLLQQQIDLMNTEQNEIQTLMPYKIGAMKANAFQSYASGAASYSVADLNRQIYDAGNQIDVFTGLPLYKLDARNRSGMLGYQAYGETIKNNKAAADLVGQNIRNMQSAYDYSTRYLKTFGDIVGIAAKGSVPFIGAGLAGKAVGKSSATFKGSGLFDATGKYYAP